MLFLLCREPLLIDDLKGVVWLKNWNYQPPRRVNLAFVVVVVLLCRININDCVSLQYINIKLFPYNGKNINRGSLALPEPSCTSLSESLETSCCLSFHHAGWIWVATATQTIDTNRIDYVNLHQASKYIQVCCRLRYFFEMFEVWSSAHLARVLTPCVGNPTPFAGLDTPIVQN